MTEPGGSVSEILDLPTAETDTALVLSPDGAGGVEFRAESGGGGLPLTTTGDLLYVSAAPYTNRATAGQGASVSTPSGEFSGNVVGRAIDQNDSTQWNSTSVVTSAEIHVDLGTSRTIARIRLLHSGTAAESATALNVDTSPDGSSWTLLENVSGLTTGNNVFDLSTPTASRYWRLDPTAAGGSNGWVIYTLELLELGSATISRLPIGSEGQVLTVTSGVPTWETP